MIQLVFYVSDSTAFTARNLGKSLLSQFESISFNEYLRPYINSKTKIIKLCQEIKEAASAQGVAPIVFASMMNQELMAILSSKIAGVIDIFEPFINTLELRFGQKTSRRVGQAYRTGDSKSYNMRIASIDYAIACDDGLRTIDYNEADLILLGVSRTGKTPTALYLALNFGLKVANFPFTSEDLPIFHLKPEHITNRHKLFGLTISPERLTAIRKERMREGSYANPNQVRSEVSAIRDLFEREKIPSIDTTSRSVEEIAAAIMSKKGFSKNILARR